MIEDNPAPTENIHARGILTVRVYRVFETIISDNSLAHAILVNSQSLSDHELGELALMDAQQGGMGTANAILTLPLKQIGHVYLSMPPAERNAPILFEDHRLDETIPAILENIPVPKYQNVG